MNPAEEYILNQPEPFRSILMHLQVVLEHTLPEAELKYKWRIPCYYIGKKPICYFNASYKNQYVDVGFWQLAHLLTKWDEYLVKENRKVVKSLRYRSLEEINDEIFIAILKKAEKHKDEKFYKRK
ncbi:MAG: DUF1801 domain-containing protein [Bacteroidia bacterium]|nr:DUF1801 domain-containing protein [Bacteroidia bacterium]NND11276.1 DUF1801 domain-containing protein [Flavobacteriaceae bacterium]NNK28704.1 DUF1801 domain-containing protein [Flavobacteriaceae bacterium]RZV61696.1 MAG: DUF1801 domain-containing protein [Flavobacteriaceae bacterium]